MIKFGSAVFFLFIIILFCFAKTGTAESSNRNDVIRLVQNDSDESDDIYQEPEQAEDPADMEGSEPPPDDAQDTENTEKE